MIRFFVRVPASPAFACDGYETIEEANASAANVQRALKLKAFVEAEETEPRSVEFAGVVPALGVAP